MQQAPFPENSWGSQAPGGYPPPPAGYGTPPPPPPPGYGGPPAGYPASAGGGIQFSVGDAFNWAWNKFTKNALSLIVPMLIYGVAMGVLVLVLWAITFFIGFGMIFGGAATTSDAYGSSSDASSGGAGLLGFFGTLFMTAFSGFFVMLAGFYVEGAFVSGCLDIADGKPVSIASFLRPPRHFGSVVVAALLTAVGWAIGTVACVLPGLIFLFFAMFTIPFVVDQALSPVDALKTSFRTVNRNLGTALLAFLVTFAIGLIGNALPFVGGLISIPVSLLIMTYTYRRLSGGQVVPMTP